MRLISRHILRALSAPFIWGIAALTGLLLLNSLPPLIEQFGGKGLAPSVMVEAVLLFLPALLVLTVPMAVLVSTLYGYSQLAAALEMVAMYSSGLSVWRMARPALIGGAVVAVINFFMFDQLVPRSNIRLGALQRAVATTTPTLALRQQILNVLPSPQGYILRADRIEPITGAMANVTIFDLSNYEARRIIHADSGSMAESADGNDLILTLHSGIIYEFRRNEPGRLEQTNFVHNRVVVRNVQQQFDAARSRVAPGEREKSTCELLDGVDSLRWAVSSQRTENEALTRHDLRSLLVLPALAAPAVSVHRPFPPHCGAYRRFEGWFKRMMLPQRLSAQTPAQAVPQQPAAPAAALPVQTPAAPPATPQLFVPPSNMSQIVASSTGPIASSMDVSYRQGRLNDLSSTMRRYQVEYHQKIAIPLSSFCFVLIGMALALKYPASGIGLVIGGSLVIFLGFYILLQLGRNIAIAGQIDPAVAMYTPLVLFTAIGLASVNALNREMGTARSGGVFSSVIELFQRLKG